MPQVNVRKTTRYTDKEEVLYEFLETLTEQRIEIIVRKILRTHFKSVSKHIVIYIDCGNNNKNVIENCFEKNIGIGVELSSHCPEKILEIKWNH